MTSTLHQPPARARRAPARSPLWRWLWRLVLAAALVLLLYILVTFV